MCTAIYMKWKLLLCLHIVFRKVNSAFLSQLRANESHKTTSLVSYGYIYLHVENILLGFFINVLYLSFLFIVLVFLVNHWLFTIRVQYVNLHVYTCCFYFLKKPVIKSYCYWLSYLIRVCFFYKQALYKWWIQKYKYFFSEPFALQFNLKLMKTKMVLGAGLLDFVFAR